MDAVNSTDIDRPCGAYSLGFGRLGTLFTRIARVGGKSRVFKGQTFKRQTFKRQTFRRQTFRRQAFNRQVFESQTAEQQFGREDRV